MRSKAKQVLWTMAIASAMSAATFAADREVKVDDRLDADGQLKVSDRRAMVCGGAGSGVGPTAPIDPAFA